MQFSSASSFFAFILHDWCDCIIFIVVSSHSLYIDVAHINLYSSLLYMFPEKKWMYRAIWKIYNKDNDIGSEICFFLWSMGRTLTTWILSMQLCALVGQKLASGLDLQSTSFHFSINPKSKDEKWRPSLLSNWTTVIGCPSSVLAPGWSEFLIFFFFFKHILDD